MKTYFNYNEVIASKDACEAISMVKGVGPIIGFGSAVIDELNNKITISPLPHVSDPMYTTMVDKAKKWELHKGPNSPEFDQTQFVGVSKDGYIFGTDQATVEVNMTNTKSTLHEVIVFAYHTPVDEAIDNPVTFLAYWVQGSNDFYTLYKKSVDPYFPTPVADRVINFNNNVQISGVTYKDLLDQVINACPDYSTNSSSYALMGIYGIGNNPLTGAQESFALVPYDAKFPNEITYSPSIMSTLMQSMQRIENILGDNTSKSNVGITPLDQYFSNIENKLLKALSQKIIDAILPIGSIILWEGTTIPDGWAEYTKASGRVVLGYQNGGIQMPIGALNDSLETYLENPGDVYNPRGGTDQDYHTHITKDNIPAHTHLIGVEGAKVHNLTTQEYVPVPQSYNSRDTSLQGSDIGIEVKSSHSLDITNGTVKSSNNQNIDDTTSVVNYVNLFKLPKAITLRYIIKIA